MAVVLPESSEPPVTTRTTTLTATRPTIQPTENATPFARPRLVSSMSTTATIGIGLSATPAAYGSSSPIAPLSTAAGS